MKSTRDALGDCLPSMGEKHENIIAMTADLAGATKIGKFKEKFPDRFFDVGIAEANMIGIASGLSEHGFKVFLSSFASFLTGRYDIIRCSLAYSQSPVVLVGTHVGMAIGKDGVTQMGLEDVSIMRALPNVKIINPATYSEAVSAITYLCETDLDSTYYLRLGRQPVRDVTDDFHFNKARLVTHYGTEVTLLTTGCILPDVIDAAEKLKMAGVNCRVVNFSTLKPIDRETIVGCAQSSDFLFSIEDHSIVGGFGSIVSEVLTDECPRKLHRIGLNDQFPESGPPDKLYDKYGLSSDKIAQRVFETVRGEK